ncbi:MAG: hypothetical protein ACJA1Z_003302 [Patiriisocius sp.]|jgi:hypothetical protein
MELDVHNYETVTIYIIRITNALQTEPLLF